MTPSRPLTSPAVTVVMPLWRADPQHLREAVESLQRQTLTDWELIVVEDPSPAPATALLKSFDDPRIVPIYNPQRTGLAAQRAQLMNLARSNTVALLDGDDICEPDRLQLQRQYLDDHPDIALVGSQLTIIDSAGRPFATRDYPQQPEAIAATMRSYNALAQPSVMVRRDAVLAVDNYSSRFPTCEDYDLWCRLVANGFRLANLPQRLLRYRRHPGQMKSRRLRETLRETIAIKRRYFQAEMTPRERLQCRLEECCLWAPSGLVLSLFQRFRYRRFAAT